MDSPSTSRRGAALASCARCHAIVRLDEAPSGETLCPACRPAPAAAGPESLSPLRRQAFLARYTELARATAASPHDVALRSESAEVAETLGLDIEALAHLSAVVSLAPDHLEAAARLKAVRRRVENVDVSDADSAFTPPPHRPHRDDPPFWDDLGGLLAFPFQGRGKVVIATGAICFAVAEITSAVSMVGGIVMLCIWGYVVGYLFDVISSTAAGKEQPPELPEVLSLLDSMVFPLFNYIAIGIAAFLPCIVVVSVGVGLGIGALPTLLLGLLTFAGGCVVLPMCLMVRGLMQDWRPAIDPRVVLGGLARIVPDYLAMFVALAAVWAAYTAAVVVASIAVTIPIGPPTPAALINFSPLGILGWMVVTFIRWPMLLYCIVLEGHLLGRVYRQGASRLGWFVKGGAEHARAKGAGVLLWLAAGAACVAFGLVGFGAMTLLNQAPGRASIVAPPCPMANGGSLSYFWENTDGPAGLATFTFAPQRDGTVLVTLETRKPGSPPEEAWTQTVGTFDPDTAKWRDVQPAYVGEQELPVGAALDVFLYGPVRAKQGTPYTNGWPVVGTERWQDTWDAYRVTDDMSGEWFFDTRTGVMVGRRFRGVGFVVDYWLVDHQGVKGLGACPAPNRDFPD